jgi:uncharacterized membrane protein YbhN (UPF0104 family)
LGRALLALPGLALIVYLVHGAGPHRVAQVLWEAGSWLPLIIALEGVQASSDVVALRLIYGEAKHKIPVTAWIRSSAIAYAMMVLLPAGRVAGEVSRAAVLSKHVGAGPAASASTQLQAAYMFANGVLSTVALCVVATWLGPRNTLTLLLGANTVFMVAVAAALLAILWNGRVGRWLERMRRRFARNVEPGAAPEPGETRRLLPWRAAIVSTLSRTTQVFQYAVVLHAVGGVVTLRGAFVTHGIHLIGATAGDMIPNQLGVMDGIYRTFAGALGFADSPARALSIAFVVHIAQLLCAGACIVTATVTREGEPRRGAAPASARASARS